MLGRSRTEVRFTICFSAMRKHKSLRDEEMSSCPESRWAYETCICERILKASAFLLGARTLLGAPGIATRSKKLLGAPGRTTRSKKATKGFRLHAHLSNMGEST